MTFLLNRFLSTVLLLRKLPNKINHTSFFFFLKTLQQVLYNRLQTQDKLPFIVFQKALEQTLYKNLKWGPG